MTGQMKFHQIQDTQAAKIPQQSKTALTMTLDPYEQQYQQYFGTGTNGNSNVNINQNEASQAPQTPENDMQASDTSAAVDPYQSQWEQYSGQPASPAPTSSQGQTGLQLQLQQPSDPNPSSSNGWETASTTTTTTDPYELQYQQLCNQVSAYSSAPPAQSQTQSQTQASSNSWSPTNGAGYSNQQQPTQQETVMSEPAEAVPSKQEDEEEEDRGDEFLRMVSSEVAYKKLKGENPYALTDIDISLLIQRFLDNIEDATQKNNGKTKGQSKLRGEESPKEERKTILVLGTGWAAHAFVKLASTYDLRIVVVSPVNHFVFTPMLASAAVGTVEYRSMTEPIRVTNPYIDNFVEGRAIGVDVANRKVAVQLTKLSTVTNTFKGIASDAPCRLEPEPVLTNIIYDEESNSIQKDAAAQGAGDVIELSYDHLICTVGTAARSSIVPGAKDYCFNLKTSQDSKRLRTAIGEALEFASRPDVQEYYYAKEEDKIVAQTERQRRVRIAIVGGGPTGVELAGEMSDFFRQICRSSDGAYQHLKDDISIMLIHGGAEVLPAMDEGLRNRALVALDDQGVELRLDTRLKEVGRDYIKIFEKSTGDEETIPVGVTVWAAGNAPVPFVAELLSQLPESAAGPGGRINVDEWLRCPTPTEEGFGSILALGDIACLEAQAKFDSEAKPLPQTAQVAGQQGAFAARLLNRGYDLQTTPPKLPELSAEEGYSILRLWLIARGLEEAPGFSFLSLGLLAYVGQEEALNQVTIGDVPVFNYSGKIAYALWRSVYLAKQASTRNQALIVFDWLRTEAFGRDITRL
eukprot:CAMPEP_0113661216 /NCGR_PEP_ID=MMETSP0017_2-20120614/33310_1 /TAXON_ID=2856 /ORGANISM="Cylindrotheca closterium" /LENGTH=804 /DNA_ID=CAMNT_0000575893 /DNA_START=258 /DNA_END=2672 /DNA_ORIENTATION=- /assembly_acc=CAM_ASM_000147